jgi:menaquinone-dependent protoporphyrinogen oxidase
MSRLGIWSMQEHEMARILIAYASRHGQTKKIAEHVAQALLQDGCAVDLIDCKHPPGRLAMVTYDAFILAASINYGKHQKGMTEFVRTHLFELRSAPSALLSVSAAAASRDEKNQSEAQGCIDAFIEQTGLRPSASLPVAGALKYTQYPWLLRMMLRMIVRKTAGEHSGDTDTKRDYEYTDWDAVDRFAHDFVNYQTVSKKAVLI